MSGSTSIMIDTNVFINLIENKGNVSEKLPLTQTYYSFITEIELLGKYQITENEKSICGLVMDNCYLIEMNDFIKNTAIYLKQNYKAIKLPDAIIAATSIFMGLPLYTFDNDFAKINELDLVLLNLND